MAFKFVLSSPFVVGCVLQRFYIPMYAYIHTCTYIYIHIPGQTYISIVELSRPPFTISEARAVTG